MSTLSKVCHLEKVYIDRKGSFQVNVDLRTALSHVDQVSFPGGHIEAGEDAVEAALRETREEIGTSLGDIEVLGLCQTLPAGEWDTADEYRSSPTCPFVVKIQAYFCSSIPRASSVSIVPSETNYDFGVMDLRAVNALTI